ncbi:MAG: zinc-binding dehydrogenase [Ideonella sp. WA131b]|jgi:NADPH:quinone reductase-like Zn-dependent oxidoreductase|nr:zinc-binding dehydrogenase [Ideonella sp. WA131b]
MKACVLTKFGNTDTLAVRHDLPVPQPGAREVLVRVDATSVNLIDCGRRSGYGAPLFRLKGAKSFPMVLGTDFSGVVTAVGGRIKTLKVGDRVWGAKGHGRWGSYAEYVVVPESEVGLRPARLGTHEAAALPYAALTGWKAITHGLRLNEHNSAGKRVLVHAGAGGVGSFAIQLLRTWGAEVITTCSAGNAALCLSLGAAQAIDYTRQDFSSLLGNLDAVLDTVGGDVEARSLSILKVHGGAAYATLLHPTLDLVSRHGVPGGLFRAFLAMRSARAAQARLGRRYAWVLHSPDRQALDAIAGLVDAGRIRPVVDTVYPGLEDIAEAHQRCESRHASGKLVVRVS